MELSVKMQLTLFTILMLINIRRGRSHKDIDGQIVDRLLCCSCEGHRKSSCSNKIWLFARMKISNRLTGKLSITEFIAEHNHQTSTPSKSHLHRSQRKITLSQAVEVDLAESCGITPKASCELMARRAGGRENLGFIPDDYMNYLHSKRTIQMRTRNTGGMLEYLQKMQLEDPNFSIQYNKLMRMI
ncbi:hypothetical protein Lal_00050141 [Lupinus albus]|nr:hypothetical protein Lal_00050141 [Lupinus albus]